jgi:membrane-bound lytic murein transglycosylase D
MMSLAPEALPSRKITHRAARGDTVATVARRYKVSPAQLAQWNKVGASASFTAGQSVVLYVPQKQPSARSSSAAKKPAAKRSSR